jgi:hypothetical protein
MGEGGKTSGAVLENLQGLGIIEEISSVGGYGYFVELYTLTASLSVYTKVMPYTWTFQA